MDALALLCNLYGDGPSTLKRLRAHGVLRIEDLDARQAGDLAGVLALSPATARRFLKEAAGLQKRVLDSDDDARALSVRPQVAKRAPRQVVRGKQAMLAAAARRWSELDRTSPMIPSVQSEPAPSTSLDSASGTPLIAIELDRATYDALHAIGTRTLEELAALDSDALAAAAGLGISQILFVQGLARRKLREHAERARHAGLASVTEEFPVYELQHGSRSDPRFSPSERGPAEWSSVRADGAPRAQDTELDEGAGPFA